jgi:hypothetical protein
LKKKASPRAERRAAARATDKLARSREILARLEPGGDASRPLVIESASQVEPSALSLSCLRCEGPYRLVDHAAVTVAERRLRVTKLVCARCGARREVWFELNRRLPS